MALNFPGIILYAITFGAIHGILDKEFRKTKDEYNWAPFLDPRGKFFDCQNISLLATYADNMFGPSVKIKTGPPLDSTGTLHLKGHTLKRPDLSEIKFDPPSINHPVYHAGEAIAPPRPLTEQRPKRGVLHLFNMVSCATGCNPLTYKGYGCYCGFLGSGNAVDGIDRCCQIHDRCYDRAKCPMFFEYIVPYFWKCYYNRPLCAINHGGFGGPGSCASRLCECDRVLSKCLSQYPCPKSRAVCRSSPLRLLQNVLMIYP